MTELREKIERLLEYSKRQHEISYPQDRFMEGYIQALSDVLELID